ncbi:hypothetical protein [Flavobacterium sp.]|uniref:hypothetical protein n=1 Tax=Flavobacterium sp. TaxID=239 RepID=UPI0011FC3EFA|nr:hypothetical protein [Flavobacterium sp.]RZJ73815.1 MAG: hypothetical protein EOO49_00205 [Flavobacterium sp.]
MAKKKIVAIRQSLICGETVHPEDLSAYCYEQAMNKAMELKFGREFMKVVRIDATKQFLGKNPKFIFGFGSCDTVARYPNCANYSEHFTNYKRDFLEKVPCPKDFTFEKVNERFSYLNASFVLHADGRISGVKVSASFVNPDDDKFAEYYLSQLEAFIENTKWVPATVYGQKVDSEVPLVIHFPRF